MPYTQTATPTFYTANPTSNYPTPISTSYLDLGNARYDSTRSVNASYSVSSLATPVVAAGQMVYSSATGRLIINVGTTASPVLRSVATS